MSVCSALGVGSVKDIAEFQRALGVIGLSGKHDKEKKVFYLDDPSKTLLRYEAKRKALEEVAKLQHASLAEYQRVAGRVGGKFFFFGVVISL